MLFGVSAGQALCGTEKPWVSILVHATLSLTLLFLECKHIKTYFV